VFCFSFRPKMVPICSLDLTSGGGGSNSQSSSSFSSSRTLGGSNLGILPPRFFFCPLPPISLFPKIRKALYYKSQAVQEQCRD
jgi:hypothetical protein